MGRLEKELRKAHISIMEERNKMTIEQLYCRILKESAQIDHFKKEEIIRNRMTSRNYQVILQGNSPYDTNYSLWENVE